MRLAEVAHPHATRTPASVNRGTVIGGLVRAEAELRALRSEHVHAAVDLRQVAKRVPGRDGGVGSPGNGGGKVVPGYRALVGIGKVGAGGQPERKRLRPPHPVVHRVVQGAGRIAVVRVGAVRVV